MAMASMEALKVGLVGCLAMIMGTGLSGLTFTGAMLLGLSRKAVFGIFFIWPYGSLVRAGAYRRCKDRTLLSMADAPMFGVGMLLCFISA